MGTHLHSLGHTSPFHAQTLLTQTLTDQAGEFGFDSVEEAVAMFTLEPEKPYIVVPCLAAAGIEAPFELRIMSGVPVELVPLPEVKCVVLPVSESGREGGGLQDQGWG